MRPLDEQATFEQIMEDLVTLAERQRDGATP